MELRHLRYFVAVAETENISRVAVKLHVSQPGISRQIRDLEDELGVQLFERSAKALKLTDAGLAFLPGAQAVLLRADEAVMAVRAVVNGERGQIHIGYAPSPTVELLPSALHAFQNIAPGVRVHLHDLSSEEMVRGLHEGKLDLCLEVKRTDKAMRGLKFECLREYPICVAVSPRHPFAKRKFVTLAQIAGEPLLAYTRADYPDYHAVLEENFRPLGVKPRIAEEHDSGSSLIAATEAGRGVTFAPTVLGIVAGGRIKLVPLKPSLAVMVVGAAYNPKKFSVAARKFLQAAGGKG
jgi:DNA-binding transcriptional LysR family regulator